MKKVISNISLLSLKLINFLINHTVMVSIMLIGTINYAHSVLLAYLYIAAPNQAASQQLINNAFGNGVTPINRSSNNSAQDFWNNLRTPLIYPYFFRVFETLEGLQDFSDTPLNGTVLTIAVDNNFYDLYYSIRNFQRILNPVADPDLSINRAINPMAALNSELRHQYIIGFNQGYIANTIIMEGAIYQNGQRIGIPQPNPNYNTPSTNPHGAGFTFQPVNQALETNTVQVLPPQTPNVFERFLSSFACGNMHGSSSLSVNNYSCTNPKIETLQQYNANYETALNSLRINPNDNVFASGNGIINGLVRLVPYPLPYYSDNIIIVPYYISAGSIISKKDNL